MMPSIITKLYNQVSTWIPFKIEEKLTHPKESDKKRISYQIQKHRRYKYDVEQDDLKMALDLATDEFNPRRANLHMVFREAKRNLNLLCEMTNAYDDVLQQGGALFHKDTGEIAEDETKLLKKRWFEKAVRIYLSDEFEGFKLLEIGELIQTENGWEIKDVKEFPVDNVLPERGLLVAHPDAQVGLPFRPSDFPHDEKKRKLAEACAEWLLECGDPENLGLLSVATKEAIYNKWGLGDWARSSERWMDPTVIINSSTDDKTENDKKAEAAGNLGNNNWMLLDEDDKVALMERKNVAAYSITKEFLEYNDKSVARGLNGQIATTDEKSFVGSAEVQERIQMKRTRRRSRSVTYWLNEDVIPKLIQLNGGDSAYRSLDGLEWRYFDFNGESDGEDTDPDQGDDPKKTNGGTPKNLSPGASAKGRKRAGGASVGKLRTRPDMYGLATAVNDAYHSLCNHSHPAGPYNTSDLDALVAKLAKKIHNRKVRPGEIDLQLTHAQAKRLIKGFMQGLDNPLQAPAFASPAHRLRVQLQYNIYVAAAFKNHHNVLEMHNLLFDSNGNMKSQSQFLKDVKAINEDYYKHWAKTEYNLAQANARMASKWMVYQDKGGALVYQAVLDDRTRPEHAELHGATYPVDHVFWDSYYPPNGWNCRCTVRWTNDTTIKEAEGIPDVKPMFRNNPGKTGKVFTEGHPYFMIAEAFLSKAQKLFGYKPPVDLDRFNANMALFQTLKENTEYQLKSTFKETGGFVFGHKKLDRRDFAANKKAADTLAEKGYAVEIREHVHQDNIKNPELALNGRLTDLKSPEKVGGIRNAFDKARKQGLDQVVIEVNSRWKKDQIRKRLDDGFFYNEEIEKAVLIWKGEVIEFSREDWLNGKIFN